MKNFLLPLLGLLLAGCASYAGRGLIPGEARGEDVIARMGPPAMEWTNPDGSRLLAYPRGPLGVHTYMVHVGADGRLQFIENVMDPRSFARITPGMNQEQVLRTLGPSIPAWTSYSRARDELAWGWRYCDEWNQLTRFFVLFDGQTELVRSTMTVREDQIGECGHRGGCWCSH